MTPERTRVAVAAHAQEILDRLWPESVPGGNCINAAAAVCLAAHKAGLRVLPQGGSASWPRLREDEDDGAAPTHFSYVYEARGDFRKLTAEVVERGMVPEIHAWVVVLADDGPEVVDITVPHWPVRCGEVLGLPWSAPQPPRFLWANEDEVIARRCRYAADSEATALVHVLVGKLGRDAAQSFPCRLDDADAPRVQRPLR